MTDDRSKTASLSPWWRQSVILVTIAGFTLGVGAMMLATSTFAQPASDHLACYLVKDPMRKGTSTVTITNAGVTQSCTIASRAQLGCLETQASNVVPAPPGAGPEPGNVGDFLCHRLVCPKPFPPAAEMTDPTRRASSAGGEARGPCANTPDMLVGLPMRGLFFPSGCGPSGPPARA